jgi:V8-like Glu-specific endopeptidase
MAWTKKLTQLNDVLSDLVPNKEGITRYVQVAGLKQQFIDTDGSSVDVWNKVLNEADKHNKVDDLVRGVLNTYPENPYLKTALSAKEINYSLSPDLDNVSNWEPLTNDTLEVLTMGKSTLLPVNFLALGVVKSKAVAKIEIKVGSSSINVGTGFLCKVQDFEDIFFITNYHVINDKRQIDSTKIIFDFELDIDGNSRASKSFKINKTGPWYCSPNAEYDVCVFKLEASEEDLKGYGYLDLKEIEVTKNDFVNIIQHPGGNMKQISLYHNIVTNVNDRVVQYLTDTLKGSSGSPVFNSDWQVVALHHSGGGSKLGEPELPTGIKSRNEGIFINNVIKFINQSHKPN